MFMPRTDLPSVASTPGKGMRMMAVGRQPERMLAALQAAGARVEVEEDLFDAIETLQADRTGFAAVAVDCDGFGGIEAVRRLLPLFGRLREGLALVLAAAEVIQPDLSPRPGAPVLLRTPLSAPALRLGLGHLLRHRLVAAPG